MNNERGQKERAAAKGLLCRLNVMIFTLVR